MLQNKKLLIVSAVVWFALIIIIVVLILNVRKDTKELKENTQVTSYVEEVPATDINIITETEVVYVESKFTDLPITLENITQSLQSAGVNDYTAETISFIFSLSAENINNWYLTYNEGYCPVVNLYVNDNDGTPYITVMEFSNKCYVGYREATNDYVFCRDGASMQYTGLIAESVRDLLNEWNTGWEWNCYDALCAWGLTETLFPNVSKSITDNSIVVEGQGEFTFGKACVYFGNGVYNIYEQMPTYTFEPDDNWYTPEQFTYDDLLLWFEANNYEVPRRFDDAWEKLSNRPTDFWYVELVSGELIFYDITVDLSNPTGYISKPFFSFDYVDGYYDFMELNE